MAFLQDMETGAPWEETEMDAPWDFDETDASAEDTEPVALWNFTQGSAPTDWAELSLVGRAERIFYRGLYHGQGPETDAPLEPRVYPDGYVRRSPPQLYRVPKGYYRRIALRITLYTVAAVLLVLLLAALMKRGLLRF